MFFVGAWEHAKDFLEQAHFSENDTPRHLQLKIPSKAGKRLQF